jgi:hypothetical protein
LLNELAFFIEQIQKEAHAADIAAAAWQFEGSRRDCHPDQSESDWEELRGGRGCRTEAKGFMVSPRFATVCGDNREPSDEYKIVLVCCAPSRKTANPEQQL